MGNLDLVFVCLVFFFFFGGMLGWSNITGIEVCSDTKLMQGK